MPLPLTIMFCLCYGYMFIHVLLRQIKAIKHKRLHVNKFGRLVTDAYRTGFNGKAPVFDEKDIYK